MNEAHYINLMGSRLQGFHKKTQNVWNFRCPICGDSEKSDRKKRGYIYQKKGIYLFYCQNCGPPGKSFKNFLKQQDPLLYKEYIFSNFKSIEPKTEVVMPAKKPVFNLPSTRAEEMPGHVIQYIKDRKLQTEDFEYTSHFYDYINKLKPGFFNVNTVNKYDHERLLINFYDKEDNLRIIQGRSLNGESPKYLTIRMDDDADKIYGMDKIDENLPIYVVEGVPDAMSLSNSIAVLDMNYLRAGLIYPKEKLVIIPDTDVRNPQVMKSVEKCVKNGMSVCLLPDDHGKDLNEMLVNGLSRDEIKQLVSAHVYRGLELKMRFSQWRKD